MLNPMSDMSKSYLGEILLFLPPANYRFCVLLIVAVTMAS